MHFVRKAAGILSLLILLNSCEQGPGYDHITQKTPGIQSFSFTPEIIDFDPDDGIKDSTVVLDVMIEPDIPSPELQPRMVIRRQDNPEAYFESEITGWNDEAGRFEDQIEVEFFTVQVQNYEVYVYIPVDGNVGNRGQQTLKVDGFPAEPPVVEEVDHPETIQIPESGEEQFEIAARATHSLGSDNIDEVLLDMYDESNEKLEDSPFPLPPAAHLGNDWYETGFTVRYDNNPQKYRLEFYAIDNAGGISDTLTSEMEFVR